jgi:D-alanyl-D-alanine endopeptidase (penicillin-binding protein 7)
MGSVILIILLLFTNISYAETVTAKSWLVADESGEVLASEYKDKVRPIASITKLITSITVIDSNVNLDEHVDTKEFGSISRRSLISMAMVRSNNQAADLLCRTYPTGYKQCIKDMNYKAQSIGMVKTKLVEPTGLSAKNVSTAEDLVNLLIVAKEYPEIVTASQYSKIEINIRKKWVIFKNTNPLIGHNHDIIVSKTGWHRPAGGCIVMYLNTEKGPRLVVVLGSVSPKTRIPEAEFISNM